MLFNQSVPERFERTVTATVEAFGRDLRKAWPDVTSVSAANQYTLVCSDVRLDIVAIPQGVRRLGILELPLLHVTYHFHGGDEPARRRFLHTLDHAMQRGGG